MPPTHPEKLIAGLENRHPSIMIWRPEESVSGVWEATGHGWTIIEPDVVQFCDQLTQQLSG